MLSVASECVPLLKTGGLADVVGALPKALAGQGWRMRVLMPAYRGLPARIDGAVEVWSDDDLFGGAARVLAGTVDGLEMLLLDAPHLYDRDGGPYGVAGADHPDNPERFAALSWAGAAIARDGLSDGWRPQIVHAHDWQAGLTPAYLRYGGAADVRSIITVHNIAFQGVAPADRLAALRLPGAEFHADGLEYYGQISTLKAGLVTADAITTVSPTYAEELMRPEYGMGLQGVIAARSAHVRGILNGVDIEVWDPEHDPEVAPFAARDPEAEGGKPRPAQGGVRPAGGAGAARHRGQPVDRSEGDRPDPADPAGFHRGRRWSGRAGVRRPAARGGDADRRGALSGAGGGAHRL